jgi:ABC-2 type transport system permease protein
MSSAALVAAFVRRDWAIARSYRVNFGLELFDSILWLVLFFYLARIVDDTELASQTNLQDGYFAFVVIGLALMRFMQTGLTSFAFKLRTDQTTGTLEALLVTPAAQPLLVLGSATYELLLSAVSGVLMLAIAVAFFGVDLSISLESALVLVAALPASCALFAAVGIVVAAFTVVFKQVATLVSFMTLGIAVLAGVYFPLSVLPYWLETVAEALPFSWTLDVLRDALLGGNPSVVKLTLLVVFCVIAVPVALRIFAIAVDQARRTGSLTQY